MSASTTPVDPGGRPRQLAAMRAAANEHLGLVISAFLVALTVFQVLVLANADPETAQAIVQAQGSVQVLTGALLEMVTRTLPLIALAMTGAPLWRNLFAPSFVLTKLEAWSLFSLGLTLAAVVLPLYGLAFLAGMGVLTAGAGWLGYKQAQKRPHGPMSEAETRAAELSSKTLSRFLIIPTVIFTAYFLLGEDPWLPRENLDLGDKVVVGYVLAADSDEVVYLDYRVGECSESMQTNSRVARFASGVAATGLSGINGSPTF